MGVFRGGDGPETLAVGPGDQGTIMAVDRKRQKWCLGLAAINSAPEQLLRSRRPAWTGLPAAR